MGSVFVNKDNFPFSIARPSYENDALDAVESQLGNQQNNKTFLFLFCWYETAKRVWGSRGVLIYKIIVNKIDFLELMSEFHLRSRGATLQHRNPAVTSRGLNALIYLKITVK